MRKVAAVALGVVFAAGSSAGAWLSNVDPHPVVVGLPGESGWRAAVAAVAPGPDAPASGAPPADVRRFFDRLTAAQRQALVTAAPGVVGNLDGAPVTLRIAANALVSGHAGRQLLAYDERGDGTVAEVFGDLEAATHVAVIVPGSGWRLDTTLSGQGEINPVAAGRRLLDQARQEHPAANVAVVVWLGYDPPEAIDRQAFRSGRAEAGATRLARFLDGLPPGLHTSVLCHSYGAVVCGLARPGEPAENVVALAAPGMDVASAADVAAGRTVWAARTDGDHIRFVPPVRFAGYGHGADPVDDAFGARVFGTGGTRGHDGYYRAGTESLANLARIVTGLDGDVTPGPDVRAW